MKALRFLLLCVLAVVTAVVPAAAARFSEDPDRVEAAADSVFMLEIFDGDSNQVAVGSGFVIFDAHILATNYHVIEDGAYVIAISDDSEQAYVSRVCAADREKDLALLYVEEALGVPPLDYEASADLKRAETVVAIGSPAGLKNTVSIGNISAFFDQEGRNWIQFTAPISSGSSGGALFNDEGRVIGITTATYASTQNVNLAVRAEALVALYEQWDGRTRALSSVTGQRAVKATPAAAYAVSGGTVWVTRSGKKYHSNPKCSKMRSPIEMSVTDAIQSGYEPCDKCYK